MGTPGINFPVNRGIFLHHNYYNFHDNTNTHFNFSDFSCSVHMARKILP